MNKVDTRLILVKKNLSRVKNILAISSVKGGVGKSVIATTIALLLSRRGKHVGLLDLDFYGPSCLKILGSEIVFPEEEKGIIPPTIQGLKVMSIEYFTGDNPLPVRGSGVTNAIIELLAITLWGELDYLVIDFPPGMGDELLEIIKLMPNARYIVVTSPSILSINVVKKLVKLLIDANVSVLGGIVNMVRGGEDVNMGVKILGKIGFDEKLEESIGSVERILETKFANELSFIVDKLESLLEN